MHRTMMLISLNKSAGYVLDVNHGDMLISMITNHAQDHPTMARLVSNTYGNITLMSKSKDRAIIELQKAASSKPKSAKQNFIDLQILSIY